MNGSLWEPHWMWFLFIITDVGSGFEIMIHYYIVCHYKSKGSELMRKTFKGLVMGIMIGVLISGSLAYAGGAPLDVYLKNWIIMIDGIQKKPQNNEVLLYNNQTYVP